MFKKVYSLYSAFCTQPAFYSQSAVCILHSVCSLRFTLTASCYPISDLPSSDLSYTHHSPTPLPLAPPLANMYSWVDGLLNLISTPPPPLLRTYPFFLLLKKSPNCIHPCRLPLVMGLPLKNFFTNSLFPPADYP